MAIDSMRGRKAKPQITKEDEDMNTYEMGSEAENAVSYLSGAPTPNEMVTVTLRVEPNNGPIWRGHIDLSGEGHRSVVQNKHLPMSQPSDPHGYGWYRLYETRVSYGDLALWARPWHGEVPEGLTPGDTLAYLRAFWRDYIHQA